MKILLGYFGLESNTSTVYDSFQKSMCPFDKEPYHVY
jgi:hypothetical protein